MALLLDDREPIDISNALRRFDVEVITTRLEFGDLIFEGSGPNDRPVNVAFERKCFTDLLNSMQSRRLTGHQMLGLRAAFEYVYVVVEGMWRPGPNGEVEIFTHGKWTPKWFQGSGITYHQIDSFLSSLELRGGVHVLRTATCEETAHLYYSRYRHWQKKWSEHQSHNQIYAVDPTTSNTKGRASFRPQIAGYVETIAAQLPGIDSKAWAVGKHFSTVSQMINASPHQWEEIEGIGPITADRIYQAINFPTPKSK